MLCPPRDSVFRMFFPDPMVNRKISHLWPLYWWPLYLSSGLPCDLLAAISLPYKTIRLPFIFVTCPSHLSLVLLSVAIIDGSLAHSRISELVTLSCHLMFIILWKQWRWKWYFSHTLHIHISEPYQRVVRAEVSRLLCQSSVVSCPFP